MDAETSMREQTELRRQEQTFGQRLQEKATQNNELIFEPKVTKAEVHTISSEEFLDSQGQEVFARPNLPHATTTIATFFTSTTA